MKRIILLVNFLWGFWAINSLAIAQIEISIPDTFAVNGDTIFVPLRVNDLSAANVYSYQFALSFNDSVLIALGAKSDNTISASWGDPLVNIYHNGEVIVGNFGANKLSDKGGVLVYIKFNVIGAPSDTTSLKFKSFLFNAGDPAVDTIDGLFAIREKTIRVSFIDNIGGHTLIAIDGVVKKVPFDTVWIALSEHTINVDSLQSDQPGVRYLFKQWNDGGNQSHVINPATDTTFIVTMDTQYYLTVLTSPPALIDIPGSGWYYKFSEVQISVVSEIIQKEADTYKFNFWKLDELPGTGNPIIISMDTTHLATAIYRKVYSISGKISLYDGGLPNVKLIISGSTSDTTNSNAQGYYQFAYLDSGNYKIIPTLSGFKFVPQFKEYLLLKDNMNNQDFYAIDTLKPEVKLIYPNGGEKLLMASSDTIRWMASDNVSIDSINLHYSKNDGKNWQLIYEGVMEKPYYIWTTPDSSLDSMKIKITVFDREGNFSFDTSDSCFSIISSTIVDNHLKEVPRIFKIFQNYPNPFNTATVITYRVPEVSNITVRIFNIMGQEVIKLVDKTANVGSYRILWDGKDKNGKIVGSGIYYCQLKSDNIIQTKPMVLMK